MAKVHFLKFVFCRTDDRILVIYDEFLELLRLPQFPLKKKIKNDSDLHKQMHKIDKEISNYGIICPESPFQKSIMEIAEGEEQAFFFQVTLNPEKPISEDHIWMSPQELIEGEDVAWWDQELIATYFLNSLKN